MTTPTGYWCPIVASSEIGKRPIGRTRFGQQLVFWRSGTSVVCMPDRCPHRGAALSLGRINKTSGALACPFHGLEFSADGECVSVPVEADQRLRSEYCVESLPVREADGYIWLWRGADTSERPALPGHPALAGLHYGEATTEWPAHYTRCIENVCDYSHLPFVHRTTIGARNRDPVVDIEMEDVPGGFRAYKLNNGMRGQYIEFLYPNLWALVISDRMMMSSVFAPIDDNRTAVYGRSYYRTAAPGKKQLMNLWSRVSQFLVFREDWPIVASQNPGDVSQAQQEKLLPSDAPVLAFRRLHRAHSQT